MRLARLFGSFGLRLVLLNLTDERWNAVGLALPDLAGDLVPDVLPAPGFAARIGLELRR